MAAANMIGIDWAVKGYHVYRIRPHPELNLILVQDPTNRYDSNAIKVMMPSVVPAHPRDFQENAGCLPTCAEFLQL